MPAQSRTCLSVCVIALLVSLSGVPAEAKAAAEERRAGAVRTEVSPRSSCRRSKIGGAWPTGRWSSGRCSPRTPRSAPGRCWRWPGSPRRRRRRRSSRRCAIRSRWSRYEAAFAAGQLGTWYPLPTAERDALVTGAAGGGGRRRPTSPVRQAQLEALGKHASPRRIARLTERLLGTDKPEVASRAALSLGVAARRGAALSSRVRDGAGAADARTRPTAGARFGAAYALSVEQALRARPALMLARRMRRATSGFCARRAWARWARTRTR